MSKFKVGDKVVRHTWDVDYLMQGKPYCVVTDVAGQYIAVEGNRDGCGWDEAYFDLYQEPEQKTFNPNPGDIIVTEGKGNWVCTSKSDRRFASYPEYDFFGIQDECFQGWMANGSVLRGDEDYDSYISQKYTVKEIILASTNNYVANPEEISDLSFKLKTLELENQILRMLLRQKGVEV